MIWKTENVQLQFGSDVASDRVSAPFFGKLAVISILKKTF